MKEKYIKGLDKPILTVYTISIGKKESVFYGNKRNAAENAPVPKQICQVVRHTGCKYSQMGAGHNQAAGVRYQTDRILFTVQTVIMKGALL